MTKSEEDYFDEEVAPLLRRALDLCMARGLNMTASVEYAPNAICNYVALQEGATQALMAMAAILYPDRFAIERVEETIGTQKAKVKA